MATVDPMIIGKNRKRAFWSLAIVAFMVPVSGWLLVAGLHPGRPDVSWAMILFGFMGLVAFTASAVAIIRTMRAPWRLALTRSHLALHTPAYDLEIPWARVSGIAVDEVNRRPGCVLILDDVASVVQGAVFRQGLAGPDAVASAADMAARLQANYDANGYHLGIPGRLLELGPEELAGLLAEARKGGLWQKEGVA